MLLAELAEVRCEEAVEVARLGELRMMLKRAWEKVECALRRRGEAFAGKPCGTSRGDVQMLRPYEVAQMDEYAKSLRDDIKVQLLTLEGVRERVEAKRVELTEAMKQRQVIESLRDRQEQQYIAAAMRAEQNQIDEMSSLRYARGM